jgi:hypothetical protein
MKRAATLRRHEKSKPWRRKDKVSPEDYAYVATRDSIVGGCVMAHLDRTHLCHDTWGNQIRPDGVFEIDHIDNGGTGKRGASERWNLVRLCPAAHATKTYNARLWRPRLRAYIERVEPREEVA